MIFAGQVRVNYWPVFYAQKSESRKIIKNLTRQKSKFKFITCAK